MKEIYEVDRDGSVSQYFESSTLEAANSWVSSHGFQLCKDNQTETINLRVRKGSGEGDTEIFRVEARQVTGIETTVYSGGTADDDTLDVDAKIPVS